MPTVRFGSTRLKLKRGHWSGGGVGRWRRRPRQTRVEIDTPSAECGPPTLYHSINERVADLASSRLGGSDSLGSVGGPSMCVHNGKLFMGGEA